MALFGRDVPVSLDVENPPDDNMTFTMKPYMTGVRLRIQQSWRPKFLSPNYKTKIKFEIDHQGQVSNPHVADDSGNDAFDKSAIDAILEAGPFPPIPVQQLVITASFNNRYLSSVELEQNRNRYRYLRQQYRAHQQQQQAIQEPQQYQVRNYGMQSPTNQLDRPKLAQGPAQEHAAPPPADSQPLNNGKFNNSRDNETSDRIYRPGQPPPRNSQNSEESVDTIDRPKTKAEFAQLPDEDIELYKERFVAWLKTPADRRLWFLTKINPPTGKTVVKGKSSK